jgi:hypothetical protein
LTAATLEVTRAKELVTTRAWSYEVLGLLDADKWAADCNTGSNPKCELAESGRTADTSTWEWPSAGNCNYVTGTGLTAVTHECQILGLTGPSGGLIQSGTDAQGTARVDATPPVAATKLYLAIDTADYSYAGSGTTALADALAAYETW